MFNYLHLDMYIYILAQHTVLLNKLLMFVEHCVFMLLSFAITNLCSTLGPKCTRVFANNCLHYQNDSANRDRTVTSVNDDICLNNKQLRYRN